MSGFPEVDDWYCLIDLGLNRTVGGIDDLFTCFTYSVVGNLGLVVHRVLTSGFLFPCLLYSGFQRGRKTDLHGRSGTTLLLLVRVVLSEQFKSFVCIEPFRFLKLLTSHALFSSLDILFPRGLQSYLRGTQSVGHHSVRTYNIFMYSRAFLSGSLTFDLLEVSSVSRPSVNTRVDGLISGVPLGLRSYF